MKQKLTKEFRKLRSLLDAFLNRFIQEPQHAWVFDLDKQEYHDLDARRRVVAILESMQFQDERDGRETDICPGIIGASATLVKLAADLNHQRDRFKYAVLEVNRKDREEARNIMAQHGYPRIHFKQLYRHLPILLQRPESIRFTWGSTRSIKKITHREAYQRLIRLAGDEPSVGYQRQLDLLAQHPRDEPIAIVQDLKPHIKANVCWVERKGQDKEVMRKMISAPLPILLPMDSGEQLPKYSAAFPDERKPRKPRADVKIEREAFLPSIRGHRYCR